MVQNNLAQHHQQIRKRIYEKHEEYPHKDLFKRIVDKLVYATGIIGPISTLPQVFTIWINKSAQDISLFTWLMYLFGSFIWFFYGLIHKEKAIIFLNAGLIIVNLLIVIGTILYN